MVDLSPIVRNWQALDATMLRVRQPPDLHLVIRAIQQHRGIPSIQVIGQRLKLKEDVRDFLFEKPDVRRAFDKKRIAEAKKLSLQELLDGKTFRLVADLPQVVAHRRRLMVEHINRFTGMPTMAEFSMHVHGRKVSNNTALTRDAAVKRAIERRAVELIGKMSRDQIRKQRLGQSAVKLGPKVKRFLHEKLGEE